MTEWRLFPEGTVPEWTTPQWYAHRDAAPHIDENLHQGRMGLAADYVRTCAKTVLAEQTSCRLVDLGAGDGGFLTLLDPLPDTMTAIGLDLQRSNVEAAKARGVTVWHGDFVDDLADTLLDGVDIVVMTEVLEHLVDPHAYLRRLADQKVRHVVASSPYTETADAHYEFHTWAFDLAGYRALFDQAGYILDMQRTVDIFQVVQATLR